MGKGVMFVGRGWMGGRWLLGVQGLGMGLEMDGQARMWSGEMACGGDGGFLGSHRFALAITMHLVLHPTCQSVLPSICVYPASFLQISAPGHRIHSRVTRPLRPICYSL